MNLQVLQHQLSQIKEMAVISKNAEIGDVICHVMGMVRRSDDTLQMLVLQYDEVYRERIEVAEIASLTHPPAACITNRMKQQTSNPGPSLPLDCIEKVCMGDLTLMTHESSSGICASGQWDKAALFTQFLLRGWDPAGIDTMDIENMFLTELTFDGTYDAIPSFDTIAPIRLFMHQASTHFSVELPITLSVGSEYPDKLYFHDKATGDAHWVQINSVTLCDMWAEMYKVFDSPQMKASLSPEELSQSKAEFESQFSQVCPKGMCYPVIEYECEKDISLTFYSTRWLEAEPTHTASAMGFIVSPDTPTGKLGQTLKTAVIQEPVAADTVSIEAELFQYSHTHKVDDIVIV